MAFEQWREKLDETQADYIPLITNCLMAVQILAVIRDYIVIDYIPTPLIIINGIGIILLAGMGIWSGRRRIAPQYANRFVMLAVMIFAIKAISIIQVEADPYPMIMAVLLFALSLCFLSQKVLIFTAILIILSWAVVALNTLTLVQVISSLVAMVIGCVLGLFVLERRIQGMVHVYGLEKRLASLETILPMCASCKKTRDAAGNWKSIEEYVEDQKGVHVSHGVCPQCAENLYGDYYKQRNSGATEPSS